jgi:hypothetical protein
MLDKYIQVLGLTEEGLNVEDVETRFKQLAKHYHPDINSTNEAHEKMKTIIDARNKLKEFLQYSIITKTYKTSEHVYHELREELYKLIERKFKILDGYTLCKKLWPSLEAYDAAMRNKPGVGAKGGFTRLFMHCGFIKRDVDRKKGKSGYKRNECSIASAKKLLDILQENKLISYHQTGKGRGSCLRITIQRENIAKFIVDHSHMLGVQIRILVNSDSKAKYTKIVN